MLCCKCFGASSEYGIEVCPYCRVPFTQADREAAQQCTYSELDPVQMQASGVSDAQQNQQQQRENERNDSVKQQMSRDEDDEQMVEQEDSQSQLMSRMSEMSD